LEILTNAEKNSKNIRRFLPHLYSLKQRRKSLRRSIYTNSIYQQRYTAWAAPAGWQGGSCPLCPMPCPSAAPPVVVRKNYMCPLHPSHPLSQRKFYEMQNGRADVNNTTLHIAASQVAIRNWRHKFRSHIEYSISSDNIIVLFETSICTFPLIRPIDKLSGLPFGSPICVCLPVGGGAFSESMKEFLFCTMYSFY